MTDYLDIQMPEFFRLDVQLPNDTWIDERFCDRSHFVRTADGSYACLGQASPVYLRCVEVRDGVLVCLDGAGRPHRYRLVPMNSDGTELHPTS